MRTKFSVRAIGPALLCLGLVAIPAVASACDMKAVDDELARMAAATPPAPQVQAAADPSGSAAADPSGSEQQGPGSQEPKSSANAPASGSSQAQPTETSSKPTAPMGHSGTEQSEKK